MVGMFCRWTRGASAGGAPQETGVGRTRTDGRPTVFHSGTRSRTPITSVCRPNEVKVVQLRRVRCPQEFSSMLPANIVSSDMVSSSCEICLLVWTPQILSRRVVWKKKRPRFHAACGNFLNAKGVERLLFWTRLGRLRRRGLRGRRFRSRRLWRGAGSRCGWSRNARLHVVSVDHCLGDVHRLAPPQHVALRPRLGSVHDDSEAIVFGILHNHRSHLLQNAAGDFLVLIPEVFLSILHGAVEELLLAFDLLLQSGERIFIQLALLRRHLLLQAL